MATAVLVTRAEPGASETARRLLALGLAPVVEPLLTITPLSAGVPDHDQLVFTSANGVRAFANLTPDRDAPVWAVGEATRAAAEAAGFARVRSADGDVEALISRLRAEVPRSASLLHAGGADTVGDLAGRLSAEGRPAAFIAVYRADAAAEPPPLLARQLAGERVFAAALVHSPKAARTLASFMVAASRAAPFALAAISQNAAAPLAGLCSPTAVAARPTEQHLLVALQAALALA
jgi:uroporphyrinogen-III synthase